jgi:hypothetical protein
MVIEILLNKKIIIFGSNKFPFLFYFKFSSLKKI